MEKPSTLLALLLPRLRDVTYAIVFGAALLNGREMLNTDGDLGRHLTLGRTILGTLQIPTRDLLSHTLAGQARPPYEWLAQLLFAIADRVLGLDGVVLLTALILAAAFLITCREAIRRSRMAVLALLLTLWAATASSLHWLTRPHVFSFLLLAIWLTRLEALREDQEIPLWQFPVIMLVWANTHGGFIFGLLAWLAYFAGWLWNTRRKRPAAGSGPRWLLTGIAALAATVVTPDSWHNWEAVLGNRSAYILNRTVETMPPDFAQPGVWPFAGLLCAAVILGLLNRRRAAAPHLILLAGLAGISLLMARNIPLFAIAAAPILASWAGESSAGVARWQAIEANILAIDSRLRGLVWPVLLTCLAALGLAGFQRIAGRTVFDFDPRLFPVGAVSWLQEHPPNGNMFNDFNWGGYLLYRQWPRARVYVDSQSDFYGEAFMRRYEQIYLGGTGWEEQLTEAQVGWIIVPPGTGLAQAAQASAQWQPAFQDSTAVIFVRK
jgi:hypothetical protein